jgi:hypothetical protein
MERQRDCQVSTTYSAKNSAIKNSGWKLDKFGCDMQVLNKKANSKRGRV